MRVVDACSVLPVALALAGLLGMACSADDSPVDSLVPTTTDTGGETTGAAAGTDTGGEDTTGDTTGGATTTTDGGTTSPDGGAATTDTTGDDTNATDGGNDCGDCDDANPCTQDKCKDGQCVHSPDSGPGCAPTVVIHSPDRGVTMSYADSVAVDGEFATTHGQLQEFIFNGASLAVGGSGPFEVTIPFPDHGMNFVSAEVIDPSGQGRAVRSFLMGEGFYDTTSGAVTETLVTNGLLAYLGRDLWDDDDLTDVDDVATVAHLVLASLDVASLIPQPLTPAGEEPSFGWCEWTIVVSDIEFEVYNLDVKPAQGGVFMAGSLANLVVHFDAQAPDFACPDAIGSASTAIVTLGAFVSVWLDDAGKVQVFVDEDDIDVVLGPLVFDITGGVASSLDWLLNWFDTSVAGWIELGVETALTDQVAPMIGTLLDSVGSTFVASFEIPPFLGGTTAVPVNIAVAPSYLQLDEDGATIGLALSGTTPKLIDYDSPGSLARNGCFEDDEQPIALPKDAHVAIALHDDLFNQGFFAAWWGGILNVTIDAALLETLELDLPVEGLEVTIAPMLPPVLTSCTPNGKTRLQLGDVEVAASFEFNGGPAYVRAFVSGSFEVDVEVKAAEGATVEISFGVTDVTALDFEIVETTGAIEGAKNLLQLILTQIIEDVVVEQLAGGVFKNFPVPVFDLSTLIPGLPAQTVLTFDPGALHRDEGYIVLNGTVVD